MKLVPDWQRVLALSLSFWMQIAGLAVLIIPEIRYVTTGQDSDPVFLWWLGILLLLGGIIGRIFRQGQHTGLEWLRIAAVAAVITLLAVLGASTARAAISGEQVAEEQTLAIAVPFIAGFEGKRNAAYQDIVGIWTICYGSTRGVRPGMVLSDDECTDLLRREIAEYRAGLHRYFTAATIRSRLTPERDTAYTSLAFNAGIRSIGKSTATRRLNAGDIAGGCTALTWWNKAGGRVIRGLARRREAERELCLAGLK